MFYIPSMEAEKTYTMNISMTRRWMIPTIHYLQSFELPQDELDAKQIRKLASKYIIMSGKLYKMGRTSLILRFLGEHEISLVLIEVHQGACESHIGGWALTY